MLHDMLAFTADVAVPQEHPEWMPEWAPTLLLFLLPFAAAAVVTIIVAYIVNNKHKNAAPAAETKEQIVNDANDAADQ